MAVSGVFFIKDLLNKDWARVIKSAASCKMRRILQIQDILKVLKKARGKTISSEQLAVSSEQLAVSSEQLAVNS
jgi:hypothetical protein